MKMLKPSIKILSTSIRVIKQTRNPDAVQRIRGRKWMTIRERWFSRHPLCAWCEAKGLITAATQLDHVVPLIDGGRDDESNFQSLCVSCHSEKTAKEAAQRG